MLTLAKCSMTAGTHPCIPLSSISLYAQMCLTLGWIYHGNTAFIVGILVFFLWVFHLPYRDVRFGLHAPIDQRVCLSYQLITDFCHSPECAHHLRNLQVRRMSESEALSKGEARIRPHSGTEPSICVNQVHSGA